MARFIIRNYGPSRQLDYEGQQICLSNDQCIETDDEEMAAALGEPNNKRIYVTDRGPEASDISPEELAKQKERKITVDDPEAVHVEKFPDEVEDGEHQTEETQQTDFEDEISYEDMTVQELRDLAEDREGIELPKGYVKRDDLIQALDDYDLMDTEN